MITLIFTINQSAFNSVKDTFEKEFSNYLFCKLSDTELIMNIVNNDYENSFIYAKGLEDFFNSNITFLKAVDGFEPGLFFTNEKSAIGLNFNNIKTYLYDKYTDKEIKKQLNKWRKANGIKPKELKELRKNESNTL